MVNFRKLERSYTGIPGLDEILTGGLPRGRVILALGEPGAGKTILCTQFLINGIEKFNEKGLYVSLEESKEQYVEEMNALGWDIEAFERTGKLSFIDASPIRSLPPEVQVGTVSIGKIEFSLLSLLEVIKNRAVSVGAQRVVVDPVSHLIFQYADLTLRRKATLDLVQALSKTGATCLLASELAEIGGSGRKLQIEEYLVHGIILMQTTTSGKSLQRVIQVEKMRGMPIDRTPRPYNIAQNGIEVYSKESVL
ncbi:MAG TPA: ATPase domain-containing protein [Methylomirabilota bacterium]|nr:ATPase domain-containing protein [Methylomirabilota bacterium]